MIIVRLIIVTIIVLYNNAIQYNVVHFKQRIQLALEQQCVSIIGILLEHRW